MTKTIVVSDSAFDWLNHRGGGKKSVALVIQELIKSIEQLEADLQKYNAWVKASKPLPEHLPEALRTAEGD